MGECQIYFAGSDRYAKDTHPRMKTFGRIVLTLATIAMFWPATRLIVAAFRRSEPPMDIIKEAAVYTVVLVVIGWLYRRL